MGRITIGAESIVMAENTNDIVIEKRDRAAAAAYNRALLMGTVNKLPPPHFFKFITDNYGALERVLTIHAPLLDKPGDASDNEVYAQTLSAVRKHMTNDVIPNIKFTNLGLEAAKPSDFALARREKELRDEKDRKSARQKESRVFDYFRYSAMAALAPIAIPANILGSVLDRFHVPTAERLRYIGYLAATAIGIGSMQANAAPYIHKLGDFKDTFNRACTPEILNGPLSNAVYTLMFDRNTASPKEQHMHDMVMAGAKQGVPAIVLDSFFRLETAHGTDFRANNSSAEGGAMMITDTQIRYAHNYGTKTLSYLEAKERMQAGKASDLDASVVRAMDYVAGMDVEKLSDMVEAKKYPGPVHDALKLITVSSITAQATALSILKKMPNINDPSHTPTQLLDMAATIYAEEHNLGATNFRMFNKVANEHPDLVITDKKLLASYAGQRTADKITEIIEANPGLYKDLKTLTAGKAIESIKTEFKAYVQKTFNEYEAQYNSVSSVMDACKTGDGKAPPATIPIWQARMYDYGLDRIIKPEIIRTAVSAQFQTGAAQKSERPIREKTVAPERFGGENVPTPQLRPIS